MNGRTVKRRSLRLLALLALAFSVLLAGCGLDSYVSKNYQFQSAADQGQALQKVYRAANKSVPEVAKELEAQEKPQDVSPESTKEMFLVYPDHLVHLQQDPAKPQDTIIEIDDKQFVKDNYDPSFLQGFLLASTLDRIFGGGWQFGGGHFGHYRGYQRTPNYTPNPPTGPPAAKKSSLEIPKTVGGVGVFTRRSDQPPTPSPSVNPRTRPSSGSSGKSWSGSGSGVISSGSKPSNGFSSPPKVRLGGGSFTRRR
ncbi:DUF4247 domain-containing protein [Kyrpidia spormannii]|uniref:DUF4247 domain-containing protein n=1 Tax=Kyrpidia spormannii TaxID=2055160 RepID=A0A2K8N881_9BACL|nr:DUF4247 domain-containing protein [Kyrpidia spormannii]ATY85556.1 DUF4247 domain-containing protein [Kyrpidia spormannii]